MADGCGASLQGMARLNFKDRVQSGIQYDYAAIFDVDHLAADFPPLSRGCFLVSGVPPVLVGLGFDVYESFCGYYGVEGVGEGFVCFCVAPYGDYADVPVHELGVLREHYGEVAAYEIRHCVAD